MDFLVAIVIVVEMLLCSKQIFVCFIWIQGPVGPRGNRGEPGDPGYPVSMTHLFRNVLSLKTVHGVNIFRLNCFVGCQGQQGVNGERGKPGAPGLPVSSMYIRYK